MKTTAMEIFDRVTPLLLIIFGAFLIGLASVKNWPDLKSFGIGVGGAGLALLTQQARSTLNNEKGGKVDINLPNPPAPVLPVTPALT